MSYLISKYLENLVINYITFCTITEIEMLHTWASQPPNLFSANLRRAGSGRRGIVKIQWQQKSVFVANWSCTRTMWVFYELDLCCTRFGGVQATMFHTKFCLDFWFITCFQQLFHWMGHYSVLSMHLELNWLRLQMPWHDDNIPKQSILVPVLLDGIRETREALCLPSNRFHWHHQHGLIVDEARDVSGENRCVFHCPDWRWNLTKTCFTFRADSLLHRQIWLQQSQHNFALFCSQFNFTFFWDSTKHIATSRTMQVQHHVLHSMPAIHRHRICLHTLELCW